MLPAGAQKNRQDVCAHAVTRHKFSKSPKTCPRYRGFSRHSAPSPGITAGRSGTAIHIGRCLSFLDLKGSTGDKHKLFFEKVSSTERDPKGGGGTTTLLYLLYITLSNFTSNQWFRKKKQNQSEHGASRRGRGESTTRKRHQHSTGERRKNSTTQRRREGKEGQLTPISSYLLLITCNS